MRSPRRLLRLGGHQFCDRSQVFEILGIEVCIVDLDVELVFEKAEQLDDGERVEDATLQEGVIGAKRLGALLFGEVLSECGEDLNFSHGSIPYWSIVPQFICLCYEPRGEDLKVADVQSGAGTLICIPTYNERENLPLIVPAVLEALPLAHVLVVDDASPDGTGQLADEMASADERILVLHREGKAGLGKAYLAAFEWALARDYEFIFEFDADFSHKPEYLPGLLGLLASQADVVVGSRRISGGGVENWGAARRFISWGGSMYSRMVLQVPVRDLTGGFNGFRREALLAIGLDEVSSSGYCFQVELKYRACRKGLRVIESPIIFPDRERGVSKMSGEIFVEAVKQVWRLRKI